MRLKFFSEEQARMIINCLSRWVNGEKPPSLRSGISYNLYLSLPATLTDIGGILEFYYRSWDKFSGNIKYPVTLPGYCPETLYIFTEDRWDFSDKYNQLRRGLMIHIITELKKELSHRPVPKESHRFKKLK